MERNSTTAPEGATTLSTKPDAAILAAWGRRSVAHAIHDALPLDDQPGYDPEAQAEQIAIEDAAEAEILAAVATTPLGVEIQIWTGFLHMDGSSGIAEDHAANIMDLDFFLANEADYDWKDRFILSALRSLRSMRTGGAA